MKSRTTHEIVSDLIGPITAVGESNADEKRLKNLNEMCELVDKLLFDISMAANSRRNYQSSMKEIGKKAYSFLKDVSESFEQEDEEPEPKAGAN